MVVFYNRGTLSCYFLLHTMFFSNRHTSKSHSTWIEQLHAKIYIYIIHVHKEHTHTHTHTHTHSRTHTHTHTHLPSLVCPSSVHFTDAQSVLEDDSPPPSPLLLAAAAFFFPFGSALAPASSPPPSVCSVFLGRPRPRLTGGGYVCEEVIIIKRRMHSTICSKIMNLYGRLIFYNQSQTLGKPFQCLLRHP